MPGLLYRPASERSDCRSDLILPLVSPWGHFHMSVDKKTPGVESSIEWLLKVRVMPAGAALGEAPGGAGAATRLPAPALSVSFEGGGRRPSGFESCIISGGR